MDIGYIFIPLIYNVEVDQPPPLWRRGWACLPIGDYPQKNPPDQIREAANWMIPGVSKFEEILSNMSLWA